MRFGPVFWTMAGLVLVSALLLVLGDTLVTKRVGAGLFCAAGGAMLLAVARAARAAGRIALHPDTFERDRHPRRFWLLVAVYLVLGLGGVAVGVAIWLGWVPVAGADGG
jgi:hypothetical protein